MKWFTLFCKLCKTPNFPKRTWNGVQRSVPSSCLTTIISIAPERRNILKSEMKILFYLPLSVDGLMLL
jgi:hypothetical protein